MAIKCRLAVLRASKGRLSLRELSARTGITTANLSRLDSGKTTRVDFGTLEKLCNYFHVTPGDLLEVVPDEPPAASLDDESRAWLGSDLSRLGEMAPYDWGPAGEPEGEPVTWDDQQGAFVVGTAGQ